MVEVGPISRDKGEWNDRRAVPERRRLEPVDLAGEQQDHDAADELAEEKQAAWLKFRNRLSFVMQGDSDKRQMVLMPQRPDEEMRVLAGFDTMDQAGDWIRTNCPEPDQNKTLKSA